MATNQLSKEAEGQGQLASDQINTALATNREEAENIIFAQVLKFISWLNKKCPNATITLLFGKNQTQRRSGNMYSLDKGAAATIHEAQDASETALSLPFLSTVAKAITDEIITASGKFYTPEISFSGFLLGTQEN